MQISTERHIILFFVPNFFTALNLACGFLAVVLAVNDNFYWACMLIVLGTILDAMDGRLARLTGTQSSFGEQFDSMSDLMSFGVAPAILYYLSFFTDAGRPGIVFSFLYLLCAALRLARFNSNIDRVSAKYFQGLPSPTAALGVVGWILFARELALFEKFEWASGLLLEGHILFMGLLMVTNLPFPSFKGSEWVRTHRKQMLLLVFLLVGGLVLYVEITIIAVIWAYIISSLVYFLLNRGKFSDVFSFPSEEVDEKE